MAANIMIECPNCGKSFGLRFEPSIENYAPAEAKEQLENECPDHDGKNWGFWKKYRNTDKDSD